MNKRFEALDAFRGICAISVVIFHMHFIDSITELSFFRGSAIFVEFFFILSGFVLAHGYGSREGLKFKTFIKARFFRIYPLHLFMLIVFLVLEGGKLLAYEFGGLSFNSLPFTNDFAPNEIIPNLLLIQSWSSYTNPLSFNYPSWSISIEFYMYSLLFCSIVFFKKQKKSVWLLVSAIAFILLYFKSDFLVESVLKGLSCFFGGAFTYVIYKKLSHLKPSFLIATLIETSLLILIVLVVNNKFEDKPLAAPLLFFATVLFFAFEVGLCSKILKLRLFQFTGKLSYSIYMTHAAILFCVTSLGVILEKILSQEIAPMIETQRYLNFGGAIVNNISIFITLITIIFISHITYNYIELKGLSLNKKRW